MALSYKIVSLGKDSQVEITIDGRSYIQTIAGLPLNDDTVLDEFLTDYAIAFRNGKQLETQATPVSQDVNSMKNVVKEVDENQGQTEQPQG